MANSDTHRELHDLFNGRDFDAIVKRVTDEFHYTDRARGVSLMGGDAFKAWLGEWTGVMSNARVTDARYLDADNTSVSMFTGRGTHDGPLGPIPASGNEIAFALCEVLTYDDEGDITGGEIYYDQASIAAQTAVVDPVLVAPKIYKVVAETDRVRVLEARGRPGDKTAMHSHPASVAVALTDCKFRFTAPGEEPAEVALSAGEVMCLPAVHHATEIAGNSKARVVIVELK